MDADPPMNAQRRDLFQSCYDFLLMFCKGNSSAQAKLFPLIGIFQDHVGIEKLNVIQNPEIQNPKPETQDPKLQIRNLKFET